MATQLAPEPVSPLVSLEEYLASCYEPDCEYNEGVLEERNVGEFEHSFVQTLLATLFTNQIAAWGVFALTEQRVQISPRRYLIPDVTVLRRGLPREPILTRPPLIAIEIMSPKDTLRAATAKAREFRAFGIENVWVIDPYKRIAYRGSETGLELVADGELTVPGTDIRVSARELFEKLDQF